MRARRAAMPGRALRGLAVGAAALLLMAGATACEPARPAAKDHVILFIHGWDALGGGDNCSSSFGSLETSLRSQGFTGKMVTIAYYDSDTNCDVSLRDWGSISNSTVWKDLSKVLSKYIYETYSKKGVTVDIVAHSMGGLIARGAVQGAQAKEAGFSSPIKVEDVASLATPFAGAAWYSTLCLWGQCSQMKPGASDIKWLATNGNPQGADGTEWTAFGSTNDDVVPVASALSIGIPDSRKITYSSLEHSDYMGNAAVQARVASALANVDS